MRYSAACALLLFASKPVFAQTFEAASVHPAKLPVANSPGQMVWARPNGGPGTADPGRIVRPNLSLLSFLTTAFNLKSYQIAGPPWIETERYDITATMPPDTTMDRYRVMLQNLLLSRFKMAVHRASREMPVYVLTVAKGGPKLPTRLVGPPGVSLEKFPAEGIFMVGGGQMIAKQQTMQQFADFIGVRLKSPVNDRTNIPGKHDLSLRYSPEVSPAVPAPPKPSPPTPLTFSPR